MTDVIPTRPAATVLLVRDGASGLEVFMVVRHHAIDFASGALVFPGGKVEPDDHEIAADPVRSGALAAFDSIDRASRVAALRETFEECGVLLARPRGSRCMVPGASATALHNDCKQRSFGAMLTHERLELALDALTPFAHWITPPIMPKRFDTRFYIAPAPQDQIATHDGAESVDSVWVNPRRALVEAENGKYTLVFATKLNLQMLGRNDRAETALAAARARKIVAVEPVATRSETGYTLKVPIEAGYGGDTFTM
jgi:8-oxo-dGTP pyrophosphatase MutT (NUDIX family)